MTDSYLNRLSRRVQVGLSHLIVLGPLCLAAGTARAGDTKQFNLDNHSELAAGKLEGVAVLSSGQVVPGLHTNRSALPDATIARALVTTAEGTSYIGTGTGGRIYKLEGDKTSLFATLDGALVTALAHDGTHLYATAAPGGQVMKIDHRGKAKLWAQLPDTNNVWALAHDSANKRLFAATGGDGKLFAIDSHGNPSLYFDAKAEHLMTLAISKSGSVYVGTSGDALLLEVSGPKKARVVYDFEGNEITSIALREGVLAVAVNKFKTSGKKAAASKAKTAKGGSNAKTTAKGPRVGQGQLWKVSTTGRCTQLFEANKTHISAVGFDSKGRLLAATGSRGELYRVDNEGKHALLADVEEKEILALDLASSPARFVTSDGAAIYTVVAKKAADRTWTSAPLDAKYQARFGQLSFRGQGQLRLRTRTGQTSKPDETWSAWSEPLTRPGPIRSPAARFLQLRAELGKAAVLYAATAHYLPRNQAPHLKSITVKQVRKGGKPKASSPLAVLRIAWKADAVDGDRLRYRISYRPEAQSVLRPLLTESQVWTRSKFDWDTTAIPDGHYVIQVEASDELGNPTSLTETFASESETILVDNRPPSIEKLRRVGSTIMGRAFDNLGPLTKLESKLDTGLWSFVTSDDGMLDTATENFTVALPKRLGSGPHVLAVRATDQRGNVSTAELEFVVQ